MNHLWNIISAEGTKKPYGAVLSDELSDRNEMKDLPCVKCTDYLYLVLKDGRPLFYDRRNPKAGLVDPVSFEKSADIEGFMTELSFAPDVILPVQFAKDSMTLGSEVFSLTVRKVTEKLYLLITEENSDLFIFDTSRFLLYAVISGKFVLGYAEV